MVAAEAGQVEHDEGVTARHVVEGGCQAGSGGALHSGCLVEVDAGAAGGFERVDLAGSSWASVETRARPSRFSWAPGVSVTMTWSRMVASRGSTTPVP